MIMSIIFNYEGLYSQVQNIHKSLAGILGVQYNAIFSYYVYSGGIVLDPDTGNYVPSEKVLTEVKLQLIPDKPPSNDADQGVNINRIYLCGHCTDPLNPEDNFPQVVDCTFFNDGVQQQGRFTLMNTFPPNTVENFKTRESLGKKIHGFFETRGDNRT